MRQGETEDFSLQAFPSETALQSWPRIVRAVLWTPCTSVHTVLYLSEGSVGMVCPQVPLHGGELPANIQIQPDTSEYQRFALPQDPSLQVWKTRQVNSQTIFSFFILVCLCTQW